MNQLNNNYEVHFKNDHQSKNDYGLKFSTSVYYGLDLRGLLAFLPAPPGKKVGLKIYNKKIYNKIVHNC